MNPLTIKIVAYAAGALLLFSAGFGVEYRNMIQYKAEQKGIAEAQTTEVHRLNKLIDSNAKDSNENIINTAKSIADYYKSHPVIRLQNDGSCSVPQANSSAPSTDGSTTSGYFSPYSPEVTE